MELLDLILKYLVVPAAVFIWVLYKQVQEQSTELAVIKATASANKEAHDREFKAMQESFKAVMVKLDSIEQALRK
jgi:hypothetical protein